MTTLAGTLDELTVLVRDKHQAGRHDQSSHTPKKYGRGVATSMGAGTPVTMEWLGQPGQAGLFSKYYQPEQRRLMQALVDGNVTREDMEGFNGFTDVPLSGKYKYNHAGSLVNTKTGLLCSGVYFTNHAMVHISKNRLYGNPAELSSTVVHEMGHHKVKNLGFFAGPSLEFDARQVIGRANLKSYSSGQLANAGLRTYSVTDGGELLADTYVVMRIGTPKQKALLLNIWGEAKIGQRGSLDAIFKVLTTVFANELRAVYNDDGTVDLTLVPTIVTRAVYEKTPWYYVDAG